MNGVDECASRRTGLWQQLSAEVETKEIDTVVLCTSGRATWSNDLDHPFRPHSNVVYLTGRTEPDVLVILQKSGECRPVFHPAHAAELEKLGDKVGFSFDPNTFAPEREPSHRAVRPYLSPKNNITAQIFKLRVRKTDSEVDSIRRACEATARTMGLCRAISGMSPSTTEAQLSEWVRLGIAYAGAECCAFPPIVAVDDHAMTLHHEPTDRRIGDRILVDIGAHQRHYAADMTRCWATGPRNEKFEWMLETVRAAHAAALEMCVPGNCQSQVEKAAMRVMTARCNERSEEVECPHRITHWVGIDVHDVGDDRLPFEKNMVLAVEPGLYLQDVGVRWEDTVCITDRGPCEVLTLERGSGGDRWAAL